MFKMDNKHHCVAQETLFNVIWQPGWEGSLGENGYMYVYGRVSSLFTWNYLNMVNELYEIKSLKRDSFQKQET